MRRQMHRFTRVIWALLAAYLIVNVVLLATGLNHQALLPQDFLLQLTQLSIYAVVVFGAAATVVDLLDQIRWNGLSPEERATAL